MPFQCAADLEAVLNRGRELRGLDMSVEGTDCVRTARDGGKNRERRSIQVDRCRICDRASHRSVDGPTNGRPKHGPFLILQQLPPGCPSAVPVSLAEWPPAGRLNVNEDRPDMSWVSGQHRLPQHSTSRCIWQTAQRSYTSDPRTPCSMVTARSFARTCLGNGPQDLHQ